MADFHELRVVDLQELTAESMAITLEVPPELRDAYRYQAGQHLTFRTDFDGIEERRSYSIFIPPATPSGPEPETLLLKVGVKLLPGGRFSGFVHDQLQVGDLLNTMTPTGRFGQRRTGTDGSRYVAIVAGSGITPLLSIMTDILAREANSSFVLIYGNKSAPTVMFAEDIADLKDRYPTRFEIFHILSREDHQSPFLAGRIDKAKLETLLALYPVESVSDWFLCGPAGLVALARDVLSANGVTKRQLHSELFYTGEPITVQRDSASATSTTVTARLAGRTTSFAMPATGSLLDAVSALRPETPFSCKGGVCGTCRVKVVEGEVEMQHNYALDQADLDAGFRLACQSIPTTERLTVDFDS